MTNLSHCPRRPKLRTYLRGDGKPSLSISTSENPQARLQCIQHYGASCVVCSFDFAKSYGDDFMGFIHVHHLIPLAAKRAAYKVDAKKDLRPVCPNCHAIIHYGGQTRSISQVKKLLGIKLGSV
jgi:5-methylcytosine-specific restriction protein A